MTEHNAREAQTPEERAKETLAALRSQYKIWGSPIIEAELTRSIREAADAAHAAGKAEGAAEERAAVAQLTEWFAREASGSLYPDLAREEALDSVLPASIRQRSEAPDDR